MKELFRDFLPRSYRTRAAAVIVVATSAIDGQGWKPRYIQKRLLYFAKSVSGFCTTAHFSSLHMPAALGVRYPTIGLELKSSTLDRHRRV